MPICATRVGSRLVSSPKWPKFQQLGLTKMKDLIGEMDDGRLGR